jgi:hypothetical protein
MNRMHNDGPMLEYFRTAPRRVVEIRLNLGRALALGYVALCVAGLILMGTIMALQV